jgi:hypothetical protein
MFDLATFSVEQKVAFSKGLRQCGAGAASIGDAAECVVRYFYDNLVDAESGTAACGLVRLYRTAPFGELDQETQDFAASRLGDAAPLSAQMKCLTLLASAGQRPEWNSPATSRGHRAIPLPSEEMVSQSPMISQLILQLGLEIRTVLHPDPEFLPDLEHREYNLFYVPVAAGSPFIPAQEDFVVPYDIKSALGFGGLLPGGDLFATVLFSKVFVPREVALTFRSLALSVKTALLSAGLAQKAG